MDQDLRRRLDNFKIELCQSADALRKLLSELDFGLGDDCWIADHSPIFGTLYYRDVLNCIQFPLAHLPFQAHLDLGLVHLADPESRRVYSEMNTGDCSWDTQDELPAAATIVPLICASNNTHLTNFSGDQHAGPLNLTIGDIRNDIRGTPTQRSWILIGPIRCPQKGAKYTDDEWHSTVRTVLSPVRNVDITGPGLKSNSADGFQRRCHPLLAACLGDYPDHVMIAQVS